MTTLHSFIELKEFNVDQLKDLLVDRFLLNLKYKGELLWLQK